MRSTIGRLLLTLAAVAALAGCSSADRPDLDLRSVAPPAAAAPAASAAPAPTPVGQAASTSAVEIHAFDLGFKPAELSVAAAGPVAVTFVNDGATIHNITFADGTAITADAGKTATGTVNVPAAGLTFLCSIPGHADAGMKGAIAVTGGNAMPGMSMMPSTPPPDQPPRPLRSPTRTPPSTRSSTRPPRPS